MAHSKSQFYAQAVTKELSLGTVADLLRCASAPHVHEVAYCGPRPQEYGLFLTGNIRSPRDHRLDMPVHERISINELCEVAALVVSRIAEYDEAREKAQRVQRELESRVRFLMGVFKSNGIDPDYVPSPPEKLYRKDDKGNFVETTNEQY